MRIRLTLVLSIVLLAVTACGNSSNDNAESLSNRLKTAKQQLDDATTITLSLSTEDLPSDATGLLSAHGKGNHSPAFSGDVKVRTGGASLSAEVIAINGRMWAKTSFAPTYLKVSPEKLQAPNPALMLSTDDGVSSLLVATKKLTADGKKRSGSDVLTTIKGVLDGNVVKHMIPSANASKRFDVVYSLTDEDELSSARLTGPFYPDASKTTYTIKLSTSTEPVTINAP